VVGFPGLDLTAGQRNEEVVGERGHAATTDEIDRECCGCRFVQRHQPGLVELGVKPKRVA